MNLVPQPPLLRQILSQDLTSRFLKEFARKLPSVLREAESRSLDEKDVDVDDALRSYLFWQTRYVLVQSLFMNVAKECGLETQVTRCEANGFPILTIKAGRLTLTIHHGFQSEDKTVLNSSLVRQQHSSINHQYMQGDLFKAFDDERLRNAEHVYVNVIFGCRGAAKDWLQLGFLKIGVPYVGMVKNKRGQFVEKLQYADYCDYNEILSMVIEREKGEVKKTALKVVALKIKDKQAGE